MKMKMKERALLLTHLRERALVLTHLRERALLLTSGNEHCWSLTSGNDPCCSLTSGNNHCCSLTSGNDHCCSLTSGNEHCCSLTSGNDHCCSLTSGNDHCCSLTSGNDHCCSLTSGNEHCCSLTSGNDHCWSLTSGNEHCCSLTSGNDHCCSLTSGNDHCCSLTSGNDHCCSLTSGNDHCCSLTSGNDHCCSLTSGNDIWKMKILLKLLLALLVGLIIVVAVLVTTVVFLLNVSGDPASEPTHPVGIDASTMSTPSTLDKNASEQLRYLRCSFSITNKLFQPELLNSTSPAFTTLAQNLSTQLRRAYGLSTLDQLKPNIQVLSFRNGSVVTDTLQSFTLSPRKNYTQLDLQNTILSIMQNRSLLQMVALPEIDPNSISIISYGDGNEDHNFDCFHQKWLVPGKDPTQITLPNQTQSCSWQFSTLSEMHIFLELHGSGMNSEKKCLNTISFYVDVIPRNSSLHTRICLDTLERRTLLLASNSVLLVWRKLPGRIRASSITARAINLKACRQNVTLSINGTSGGIVETPLYPEEYPDNINCQWTISIPERDYDLELSFIEGVVLCQNDSYLHGHWLIERQMYCMVQGMGLNTMHVKPNGGRIHIEFVCGNYSAGRGMRILYHLHEITDPCAGSFKCNDSNGCGRQCDGIIDCKEGEDEHNCTCRQNVTLSINGTSGGIVETPLYPEEYPDNINCQWTISIPERDYDLELSFIEGVVLCQNDSYLHGHWLIERQMYCMVQGMGLSTMHVKPNGGRIHIEFVCGNCSAGRGMRILYHLHEITDPNRCSAFTFRCGSGEGCISKVNPECDGIFDCNNGIDEQNCTCVNQSIHHRIIGGQNAILGRWPWQVAMLKGNSLFCSATLISTHWLVTAAHCIPSSISSITVHLGKLNHTQRNSEQVTRKVKQAIVHPKYNARTTDYDVALLHLKSPVAFSSAIQPACLPASSHLFAAGEKCWVTGWGNTGGDSYASILQELEINLIGQENCSDMYSKINDEITPRMMCAGFVEGGKDSCQGDSGGPLACQSRGSWFLAGIVSWGHGCALPNFPGVYTRVTSVVDWIKQIMTEV
uniref:transmembrane protease serine 6-like isoform X2 n=1 Tax=Myxine glutinosa TaxID=7769 RepID=UPI00358FB64D